MSSEMDEVKKRDGLIFFRNCGLYVTLMLMLLMAVLVNPVSIWIFMGVLVAIGVAFLMIRMDELKTEEDEDNAEKTEK